MHEVRRLRVSACVCAWARGWVEGGERRWAHAPHALGHALTPCTPSHRARPHTVHALTPTCSPLIERANTPPPRCALTFSAAARRVCARGRRASGQSARARGQRPPTSPPRPTHPHMLLHPHTLPPTCAVAGQRSHHPHLVACQEGHQVLLPRLQQHWQGRGRWVGGARREWGAWPAAGAPLSTRVPTNPPHQPTPHHHAHTPPTHP